MARAAIKKELVQVKKKNIAISRASTVDGKANVLARM